MLDDDFVSSNIIEDDDLSANETIIMDEDKSDDEKSNATQLVRKSYSQTLTAKWILNENGSSEDISGSPDFVLVLQPNDEPTFLSLAILSPTDLGGTLQVELSFEKVSYSLLPCCCCSLLSPLVFIRANK